MLRFSLASCVLAATLAGQGPQQVDVGAEPTFTFQKPLVNGRGLKSLADLKGRPTMIEFWGTR